MVVLLRFKADNPPHPVLGKQVLLPPHRLHPETQQSLLERVARLTVPGIVLVVDESRQLRCLHTPEETLDEGMDELVEEYNKEEKLEEGADGRFNSLEVGRRL